MDRPATRDDWRFVDIGDQSIRIILKRRFSSEELGVLRSGHRPEDMDDRWGSFMEGDTLYLYRSWTGNCIYRLRIDDDGENELSVNTDHEVYRYEGDEQKELDRVNSILNIWLCGE